MLRGMSCSQSDFTLQLVGHRGCQTHLGKCIWLRFHGHGPLAWYILFFFKTEGFAEGRDVCGLCGTHCMYRQNTEALDWRRRLQAETCLVHCSCQSLLDVSEAVDDCGLGVTTSCTRSTAVFESKLNGVGGEWDEVTKNPIGAESAKKKKRKGRKRKQCPPTQRFGVWLWSWKLLACQHLKKKKKRGLFHWGPRQLCQT